MTEFILVSCVVISCRSETLMGRYEDNILYFDFYVVAIIYGQAPTNSVGA